MPREIVNIQREFDRNPAEWRAVRIEEADRVSYKILPHPYSVELTQLDWDEVRLVTQVDTLQISPPEDLETSSINSVKFLLVKLIFRFKIVKSDKLAKILINFYSSFGDRSFENKPSQSRRRKLTYGVFIS